MTSVVSQELNYQPVTLSHGTYQLSRTPPQVAPPTVTAGGGEECTFEISPKVINLGKSILRATITPSAGAADTFNWCHVDGMAFIRSIQLYNKQGLMLCDINNLNMYLKTVSRRCTAYDDLRNADNLASNTGSFDGLLPNNGLPSVAAAAGAKGIRPTEANFLAVTPYLEAAYLVPGGRATATPVIKIQFQLSKIFDTIFLNKNQYFGGESIYMRIVWEGSSKCFLTSAASGNAAAAYDPWYGGGPPTAHAGTYAITNLNLYLAVETNPIVIQSIMDKYNGGQLSYLVPYVYMNTQTQAVTPGSIQVRWNRGNGSKLLRIYWSAFDTVTTGSSAFDNAQVLQDGTTQKVASFHTTINSIRTTQYDYNLISNDHWLAMKDMQLGGCILSSNEHLYNWCHVENFTGTKLIEHDSNLNAGLPLDQEILWQAMIDATIAGGGMRHFVFSVTQKQLTITPSGIQLI